MSALTTTWTTAGRELSLARPQAGLDVGRLLEDLATRRPVVVVVPVHNGGDVVARCLDSVLRWTRGARIVVIDDASTDPATVALLDTHASAGHLELVRHADNRGYTVTANEALHLDPDTDVVLLNSDTEVGPMWLQRLRWVAASRAEVATVSAVSDNAGAMAMPSPGVANPWPAHLPWDEIALAAAQADLPWSVVAPTGHGFCMLVRREAITRLGGFDEALFPRGYGEENDFCQRAVAEGMVNLVAGHVMVRHARGQSFGSERELLIAEGRQAVDGRHPTYTQQVGAWMSGSAMAGLRARHTELLAQVGQAARVRPRRMYVLHRAGGGTPATNLDLMTALAAYQDSYLVESADLRKLVLHRVTRRGVETLATWEAGEAFRVTDTWRQDYAETIGEWIVRLGVETVHVRHLINHPLTALSQVVDRLGLSLVVSTHDFYLACPSVHLLDQEDRFCGGRCTPGAGPCRMPTPFVAEAPDLKHHWIHEWRRRVDGIFSVADAVVATTPSAASIMVANYPTLRDGMTLIEHGRNIEAGWEPARAGRSRQPGPLRILAVANWDPHKGTEYVRAMGASLGPLAEVHVMGQRSDLLADVGVVHGPYQRNEFPAIVQEIDPDLVALVSIWPETYSHTLTESWALGVPVLATDIGAVAERIRTHGGGVLAPVDDPLQAADRVRELAGDPAALEGLRATVPRDSVRSRAAMAEDYRALYDAKRTVVDDRAHLGYVVRGQLGEHPGSAHVRVLRRLDSPGTLRRVTMRQAFPEEIVRSGPGNLDVLLVQRDALTELPAALIRVLRTNGVRLVAELDDDLVSDHAKGRLSADPATDARLRMALTDLLREADHVVTSTELLADRLAPYVTNEISVVPNQLDPRLWRSEVPPEAPPRRDEHRVLYMGSRTHLDDLLMLEGVVARASEALGKRVVLEVVGVADRFEGDDWIKRLRLPRTMQQYPDFVRWLRLHRARWSAAVAPLVDTPFNATKSDLKLLEYSGLGLPVVASDVGPYRDSAMAVLTENTEAAWVSALTTVLADPEVAAEAVQRADSIVTTSRLLDPVRDHWLEAVLGEHVTEERGSDLS